MYFVVNEAWILRAITLNFQNPLPREFGHFHPLGQSHTKACYQWWDAADSQNRRISPQDCNKGVANTPRILTPWSRQQRSEVSWISHPVTFHVDDHKAEYQVSREGRTKKREKQTKRSKLLEAVDFERTTSLSLLEITLQRYYSILLESQRRDPWCFFLFSIPLWNRPLPRKLRSWNVITTQNLLLNIVTCAEEFCEEYLASIDGLHL